MMAGIMAKVTAETNPVKRRLAQLAIETGRQVIQCQQRREPLPLLQDLGYTIFDRLVLDRVRDRVKQFTGLEVLPRLQGDEFIPPALKLRHALLDQLILSKVREGIGLDKCRVAATGAAPLSVDVAEFFAALGLPLMEVWGLTETTAAATCNPPGQIKIGAVGPAFPGVEVKVAEDGEILVRGPICTPRYWKLPEATEELIDEEGWLHTGDLGRLDADGYFWIVGRKKELIITAGGKNISPANIEGLIKSHELVGQALAYGDRKPFPVALITLDSQVAEPWAEKRGIAYTDISAFSQHPIVVAEVDKAVQEANSRLAHVEQIKKFRILPTEWTAESEELTPTMKLKRNVIHDKYKDEIEKLYSS
jgi:long-chain acyl-CoA synthetase